jgi:hypothetical protein
VPSRSDFANARSRTHGVTNSKRKEETSMKKVALIATILALALSASAQQSKSVSSHVVLPSARGGASANAITTSQAPNAQSVSAKQPPVAAAGTNAIQVGATASKPSPGICLPIWLVDTHAIGLPCK